MSQQEIFNPEDLDILDHSSPPIERSKGFDPEKALKDLGEKGNAGKIAAKVLGTMYEVRKVMWTR